MATSVQLEFAVSKVYIMHIYSFNLKSILCWCLCPERLPCSMNGQFTVVNVMYEDFLGQFIGGGLTYTGRVGVCLDGVFGSVCDANWDQNDATVFCNSDFSPDGDYGECSPNNFICPNQNHNGMHSSFRYIHMPSSTVVSRVSVHGRSTITPYFSLPWALTWCTGCLPCAKLCTKLVGGVNTQWRSWWQFDLDRR